MSNLLLSKIGHVISEFPLAFKQTKEVKLFMTLLVKNEEGMLEENLQFHKAMGVDGFIITDNNSTDSTPDIIRKYKQKGWIKEVIEEKATNYEQKDWVDRMIWKAKTIVSIRPRACFSPSYNKVKSQTKHVWLLTLL
mgnify:CR=1 FL=1